MNKNEWATKRLPEGEEFSPEKATEFFISKVGYTSATTPPSHSRFVQVIVFNPEIDELFLAQDMYIDGKWSYFEAQQKDQVLAWKDWEARRTSFFDDIDKLNRKEEILAVQELGEKIGYGNLMDIASALWAMKQTDEKGQPIIDHVSTIIPNMKHREAYFARMAVRQRVDEIKKHGITSEKNGGEA